MWILYQLVMGLALLLAAPVLLAKRGRHYLSTLPGRLGHYQGLTNTGALWLHAVSVGEVGVAQALIEALPKELPLLITTVTPTGQSRAQATLGRRAIVTYLPFDLGFAIRRFLVRFSPRGLILVEGDLWPLLLRFARRRGMPVVVVNGRISDASFRRMRRLRALLDPLLSRVDCFGVQSAEDARRLLELGVEEHRLCVTGNLKYESPPPHRLPDLEKRLLELAEGRSILVAGSTMHGEEGQVLDAFIRLGGGRRALLVLAPRHPDRWPEVEELCAARELALLRRSRLSLPDRPDVILLDSLGELAGLYRLASGAFIGGTLVDTGGHNPLEPARFAVPIAVGPSMHNFREISEQFDHAQAWRRVAGAEDLAAAWQEWLEQPETGAQLGQRSAALMEANQGALTKTLALLKPLLPAPEEL